MIYVNDYHKKEVVLMATSACSQNKSKQGIISFIVKPGTHITTGDEIKYNLGVFQILDVISKTPSKSIPGHTLYRANAKYSC